MLASTGCHLRAGYSNNKIEFEVFGGRGELTQVDQIWKTPEGTKEY